MPYPRCLFDFGREDLDLSPVGVNLVYVFGPLGIALCGIAAQKLSVVIGRVQTTLLCKFVGIGMLAGLAFVDITPIVIALYLVRTWLMNCTQGGGIRHACDL